MGDPRPLLTSALRGGLAVWFTAVCFLLVASCDQGPPDDVVVGENCADAADNDGDGWFDCDDPDCAGFGGCNPADDDTTDDDTADDDTTPADDDDDTTAPPVDDENEQQFGCSDEADNDGDGDYDCADSDCEWSPACDGRVDHDGDGYCRLVCWDGSSPGYAGDCDETNPSVHPGAPDIWGDGVDNDCDGVLPGEGDDDDATADDDDTTPADDDDDTTAPAVDSDGDGSPDSADCNDGNSAVYPGATETCNSVDDDCDGTVDEGCSPPTGNTVQVTRDSSSSGSWDLRVFNWTQWSGSWWGLSSPEYCASGTGGTTLSCGSVPLSSGDRFSVNGTVAGGFLVTGTADRVSSLTGGGVSYPLTRSRSTSSATSSWPDVSPGTCRWGAVGNNDFWCKRQ